MGGMDKNFYPIVFIHNVVDLGIEDPKGKSIEEVAHIRDEIKMKVRNIITNIEKETEIENSN
jgi:protein-tyrosine-phosphatase